MSENKPKHYAVNVLADHFKGYGLNNLTTLEKVLPSTVKPDLEVAVQTLLAENAKEIIFHGLHSNQGYYQPFTFSSILAEGRDPTIISPAQYMDIQVGGGRTARCITTGIWLFKVKKFPAALMVSQKPRHEGGGVRIECIASNDAGGLSFSHMILERLVLILKEESVYKGKVLSFATTRMYEGGLGALTVYDFPHTSLDDLVLPKKTLETLNRTVFEFIDKAEKLKKWGFSTKRGILLYGPPGTGKTHFIRYCLSNLSGYTSFIVSAEQVGYIYEIIALARALQPSMIIIEDADLIARSREDMGSACEEILLNKLLNEMDGLSEDSEMIFILTTNRPEALEDAIKNRPGRIDQAIEIPKPDKECRKKLLSLYKGKASIPKEVLDECVKRTEGVTASFIKELARRMAQFALVRHKSGKLNISKEDMRVAFEDMFIEGTNTAELLGYQDKSSKSRKVA